MERAILIFCLLIMLSPCATAQEMFVSSVSSVGCAGLASLSLVSADEALNPSSAAFATDPSLTVECHLPYFIGGLRQLSIRSVIPFSSATIRLSSSRSGAAGSSFTTFGGGLTRQFGNHFALGLDYQGLLHTLPFDRKSISSFSTVGVIFTSSRSWAFSLTVRNIERCSLTYTERTIGIPTAWWFGLRYSAPRYLSMALEGEKSSGRTIVGRGALCLRPSEKFYFTLGFSTYGSKISLGAGFSIGSLDVRVALAHHLWLGPTSAAAVRYRFAYE